MVRRRHMVIVRCPNCLTRAPRLSKVFLTLAEPVGYPESAVICGVAGCNEVALVLMQGLDAIEYRGGQRVIFSIANNKAKVRVKQPPREALAPVAGA
jgi:hypothetical protein